MNFFAEAKSTVRYFFNIPNVRLQISVGDVIVPVIGARDGWSDIRRKLFSSGAYPGVEYLCISISCGDVEFNSVSDILDTDNYLNDITIKIQPVYPLIKRLERDWPVSVPLQYIPIVLTPFTYNLATAWAAISTSLALVLSGSVLASTLTLSVISSRSMEPELVPGDAILVEKISHSFMLHRNEVIFFSPPQRLLDIVNEVPGSIRSRDLFVKRIVGLPGDEVVVQRDGYTIVNGETIRNDADIPDYAKSRLVLRNKGSIIDSKKAFVLGDNAKFSVDSRIWGDLPFSNIVGRPILRIFPLDRIGRIR